MLALIPADTVEWIHAAALALSAVAVAGGLALVIRSRRPELRLSVDGIDGPFGLIEWSNVESVELKRRPGVRGRESCLRLRPGATRLLPSGEFPRNDVHELGRDRLVLATGHLDVEPQELTREIERYLLYAAEAGAAFSSPG